MIMQTIWSVFRRVAHHDPQRLARAGLIIFLAIIGTWVTLIAVGWALIIWPRMLEEFLFSTGLDPSDNDGFITALYVSLVTLATLGYGDIVPTSDWLRILQALEALTGFALVTASLTWLLSIYPVIGRRRALAHWVSLVRESEAEPGSALQEMSPEAARQTLQTMTSELIAVTGDLQQFPITYYFYNADERAALPGALPYLLYTAKKVAASDQPPSVHFYAAQLLGAIDDFADTLGPNFLPQPSGSTNKVLAAYAHDHFRRAPRKKRHGSGHD
jgi:hypothetical protein